MALVHVCINSVMMYALVERCRILNEAFSSERGFVEFSASYSVSCIQLGVAQHAPYCCCYSGCGVTVTTSTSAAAGMVVFSKCSSAD
jgi:hypothetical protein